ncbi:MAG: sulfur carrier protein ThiS [Rhodococcus sp. (in: high G+C Gram-positive bacteria)]
MIPVGVTVNGTPHELDEGTTVQAMLAGLGLPDKGVAVAVDGAVFSRSRWDEQVERGWTIEVLTAVQGG